MEPILHVLIPLLILLALFPKLDKKLVIGLSLLALLPDLDFIIPTTHRIIMHNIFFASIISLIIYLISNNQKAFYISLYYLISHLLLDLTLGGLAIFYPIYKKLIEITISLNTNFMLELNIKTYELSKILESTGPHYFFTKISIIVFFLFLVMLIIKYKNSIILYFRH